MELYVNGTPIDITLSEGDTVQSLLQALDPELRPRIIASLVLDGAYASCEDPQVLGIPLKNIGRTDVFAATREEIGISLLGDAQGILIAAAEELKNGSTLRKKEILEGLAWIVDSLDALRQSLPFPPADIAILHGATVDLIRMADQNLSLDETLNIASALMEFQTPLENLKKKLAHPESHSEESVRSRLTEIKELLPELAGCFQTGQDVEALSLLGRVLDALEMYMRYAAEEGGEESRAFAEGFKALSSSLLEAFENKDYALIADILEFDLAEEIDSLLES